MNTELAADEELLIAEYTLGLLDRQEAVQAQTLLSAEKGAAAVALQWEDRFLRLVDQLPPLEPSAHLLQHIQARLGLQAPRPERRGERRGERPRPERSAGAAGIWNNLWLWRIASLCLAIVAIGLGLARKPAGTSSIQAAAPAALQQARVSTPQASQPVPPQLAILQAPGQSSTPAWTVTYDAQHDLLLKPLVHSDIPASSSAQLWTHPTESATPRSLGVIDPNQTVKILAANVGDIVPGQIFEITLEPQGGSPTGPTGPVLFIGRMISLAP